MVREHLTRRRGGKRGKRTAKQKGAPPRPPTKAQAPRPGEGGRRGGERDPLGKAAKATSVSRVVDKVPREPPYSGIIGRHYRRRVKQSHCRTNPEKHRKFPLNDAGEMVVILGAPPCLNWRNWRTPGADTLVKARQVPNPRHNPTRRATPNTTTPKQNKKNEN